MRVKDRASTVATHRVEDAQAAATLTRITYRVTDGATPDVGTPRLVAPSIWRGTLLIVGVKISLAWLGFDRTLRIIRDRVQRIAPSSQADTADVRATEYAVALAAAIYPGRALCLEQSLIVYYVLRRQGIPVQFAMGVQHLPFVAHAWVEYKGEPITDVKEHVQQFVRLPGPLP
jgi:hypothetical protein